MKCTVLCTGHTSTTKRKSEHNHKVFMLMYLRTDFKAALKSALYDFTGARDFYREAATVSGIGMHKDVVAKYIELQALLLTPLAPHWCDYIWQELLGKVSHS